MTSASFHFDAQASLVKKSAAASSVVNLNLDSTANVDSCAWSIVGTSNSVPADWVIANANSITGATVTCPSGTNKACIVKCIVNGGSYVDSSGRTLTGELVKTAKIYTGIETVASNETFESDAANGWGPLVNAGIAGRVPLPATAVVVRPSGDATGATDRAALAAVVGVANAVAVLDSAATYYDDGTAITWASGARAITTDGRPAFWDKGSTATTHMTAIPGCISRSGATITMRLPPAANWPAQLCMCEATNAITVTVDPDGSELIGVDSTVAVGGTGERLTVESRGTSPLLPIDLGSSATRSFYGEGLFGLSDSIFFKPGVLTGGSSGEFGNYEFYIGRLRSGGGFASGTAMVGKDVVSGTTLFDWQIFGSGSATGYLYWREAFTVGRRVQATGAVAAGQGIIHTALGASCAIVEELNAASNSYYVQAASIGLNCIEVSGAGNIITRCAAAGSISCRPGAGAIVETDWQTASAAGLEQDRHLTTTTTNATPTNLTLIAAASITDNRTIRVMVEVLAYHATNAAGYTLTATFRKVGGVLTQIGATTQTGVHEDTGTMDATLAASSGDIVATVTGVAATTIRWEAYVTNVYAMA